MEKIIRQADLLPFTSNDAASRTPNHVFRQDGYVVATDGHIMVRVPVGVVAGGEDIVELDKPCVRSVIPEHFDEPKVLRLKAIESALGKTPKVDAQKECPECGGSGRVMWIYDGMEDYYEQEFRCPCCNGRGYVPTEGEVVPDPKQVFTMLGVKFQTKHLQRLVRAFGVVGAKQGKILGHQYQCLYIEAGPAQILIAGVYVEDYGTTIKVL